MHYSLISKKLGRREGDALFTYLMFVIGLSF